MDAQRGPGDRRWLEPLACLPLPLLTAGDRGNLIPTLSQRLMGAVPADGS